MSHIPNYATYQLPETFLVHDNYSDHFHPVVVGEYGANVEMFSPAPLVQH